jgi:NAD-dependent histone deacetylase SIR2
MVQDKPAPLVTDLAAAPAEERAPNATSQPKKTIMSTGAPKSSPDDNNDWDSASLYEEILDEVDAFEYSQDGELPILKLRFPHNRD